MFNPYQQQIDELTRLVTENELLLTDPELGQLAQQEVESLTAQKNQLEELATEYETNSQVSATASPAQEHINCIVEIRQGAGGDEAAIWGHDLLRMYLRFAEIMGIKVEYLDDLVVKFKGRTHLFSEINQAQGLNIETAYSIFKYESGVHRVQRVPATESAGRIHTSTASVAVLPEVHPQAVVIRDDELDWQFMRAGGAGGQNVNKVNSAVRLTHVPSGIAVSARQERTQGANREIALGMLRSQLWEMQEEKRLLAEGEVRSVIGRANRSEKIRTFNFPQNRVTDHRINESWHNLDQIMEGDIEDIIVSLHAHFEKPETAEAAQAATDQTAIDQTAE